MNRQTDEEKKSSPPSLDVIQRPAKESFRWYAYVLSEYANDWWERHPNEIIEDDQKPLSAVSRLMNNLKLKFDKLSKQPKIEIPNEEEVRTNIIKILSKLVSLERTLSKVEKNPTQDVPDDFVTKLYEVVKLIETLVISIRSLDKYYPKGIIKQ